MIPAAELRATIGRAGSVLPGGGFESLRCNGVDAAAAASLVGT